MKLQIGSIVDFTKVNKSDFDFIGEIFTGIRGLTTSFFVPLISIWVRFLKWGRFYGDGLGLQPMGTVLWGRNGDGLLIKQHQNKGNH